MALSKWPLKGWVFCTQRAKNETPPETLKLKVREVSQIGFWNISWQPTSVPSFSQIGWPQVLAPGTLSQTMTQLILAKTAISPIFRNFCYCVQTSPAPICAIRTKNRLCLIRPRQGSNSLILSLNFIRLLRVVITPSLVERRKRLEAIGWISGYLILIL